MNEETGKSWLDKLDKTIADNSKLSLIILGQFVLMVMLVIGYMKMIDKINVSVELPKTIKEEGSIRVGKRSANEIYYQMWAREDTDILSEFNHQSIKEKMEYLKDRMYPPVYYKYEALLKKFETRVSTDLIKQEFTFDKKDITSTEYEEGQRSTVTVNGYYKKWFDEQVVVDGKECAYTFGYFMKGGHIYVESFKTTCQ